MKLVSYNKTLYAILFWIYFPAVIAVLLHFFLAFFRSIQSSE